MEGAGMGLSNPLAMAATRASVCSRWESICRWKSLMSSPSSAMIGNPADYANKSVVFLNTPKIILMKVTATENKNTK